jgi:hypothetical protein
MRLSHGDFREEPCRHNTVPGTRSAQYAPAAQHRERITAQIRGNPEKQETFAMRTTLLPLRLTPGIALSVDVSAASDKFVDLDCAAALVQLRAAIPSRSVQAQRILGRRR